MTPVGVEIIIGLGGVVGTVLDEDDENEEDKEEGTVLDEDDENEEDEEEEEEGTVLDVNEAVLDEEEEEGVVLEGGVFLRGAALTWARASRMLVTNFTYEGDDVFKLSVLVRS
jgi:hypothetical protein